MVLTYRLKILVYFEIEVFEKTEGIDPVIVDGFNAVVIDGNADKLYKKESRAVEVDVSADKIDEKEFRAVEVDGI